MTDSASPGNPIDRRRFLSSASAAAALTLAPDAVHIDTTDMPIHEVVARVMAIVAQKKGAP